MLFREITGSDGRSSRQPKNLLYFPVLAAMEKMAARGQVAEWSNVPDSKSGVRASVPWVRIPPCPPVFIIYQ